MTYIDLLNENCSSLEEFYSTIVCYHIQDEINKVKRLFKKLESEQKEAFLNFIEDLPEGLTKKVKYTISNLK